MTLDKQIEYMKIGRDALALALRDKALPEARRIRIMEHAEYYDNVIESLARLRGLEK